METFGFHSIKTRDQMSFHHLLQSHSRRIQCLRSLIGTPSQSKVAPSRLRLGPQPSRSAAAALEPTGWFWARSALCFAVRDLRVSDVLRERVPSFMALTLIQEMSVAHNAQDTDPVLLLGLDEWRRSRVVNRTSRRQCRFAAGKRQKET